MEGMKKLYVQADEICEDWGVSKSQAYKMIQELNRKMLSEMAIHDPKSFSALVETAKSAAK